MNPHPDPSKSSGTSLRAGILIVISALVAFLVSYFVSRSQGETQAVSKTSSSLETVLNSGVIRCGYVIYPPGLTKDPNSGVIDGVFPKVLEEAARNLDLKIEWVEEVGWGSMIEGLEANRYDMICSPVWANAGRAKRADFTIALFYSGIGVYVRSDDNRFTEPYSDFNATSVKLATIDGEMSDIIARQDFPSSDRISLPQMSDVSQLLLNVTTGKADATFVEPYIAEQFLASNPNSVKNLTPLRPVRIFPNTMMVRQGEHNFRRMIDVALSELVNSGYVERTLATYSPQPGTFYQIANPYRTE